MKLAVKVAKGQGCGNLVLKINYIYTIPLFVSGLMPVKLFK